MATNWKAMRWFNPPLRREERGSDLWLRTAENTDFWQQTYYGFAHDDGHFLHQSREGEFTIETAFTGRYEALYDQAGLMVRKDALNWMKCGIEFTDGDRHFSTVVTVDGRSDWSAFALPAFSDAIEARATRLGDALFVQYRTDPSSSWKMARLAYFPKKFATLDVGIVACSPKREGFEAAFHRFALTDPVSRDIH